MQFEISGQIFEKSPNIKFQENPSSGSRVVPCGQTDGRTDRWTDMTKLIVAFRNFANVPNNVWLEQIISVSILTLVYRPT
jgi:hypothetical protein